MTLVSFFYRNNLFSLFVFFVSLPLIVRGEIRAVEGNLCLYPDIQILENFEKGYKMRVGLPILYSTNQMVGAYRLGEQASVLFSEVFQSLYVKNGCGKFPSLLFLAWLYFILTNLKEYKMKRGWKITIAIFACLAIWFLFLLLQVITGIKYLGNIGMILMIGLIVSVWRKIVGKRDNDAKALDKPGSKLEETEKEKESCKRESAGEKMRTIMLSQDGIEVSMVLPSIVIDQMDSIKKQEPKKWTDKEVELVREAKRYLKTNPISLNEEKPVISTESKSNAETINIPIEAEYPETHSISTAEQSQQRTPDEIEASDDHTITSHQKAIDASPVSQNNKPQPTESLFGNKLESEYRRESKAESHWIRQDDTEICINIEDAVYKKMVELQSENPKKWVNKELDLFKKAKSLLLEQGAPKSFLFRRK